MLQNQRNVLLGRRVRELRKERGLTQEQLSELIGKTDEVVSNIERGAASTKLSTLFDLADALKVSIVELFDWVSPRKLTAEEIKREDLVTRFRAMLRGDVEATATDIAEINTALVNPRPRKKR